MKELIATILTAFDFEADPTKEFVDQYYEKFWPYGDPQSYEDETVVAGYFRITWLFDQVVFKTVPVDSVAEKQCESEMRIYEAAKKAGVQQHFAKPFGKVFCYKGISCWAYEKVEGRKPLDRLNRRYFPLWKELHEFLERQTIGDLHRGNFKLVDNIPVIVDYAGATRSQLDNWEKWLLERNLN